MISLLTVPIMRAPAAINRLVWPLQSFRPCLLFPRLLILIGWLVHVDKRAFARAIRARGDLTINCQDYYISRTLAGRRVTCWVNAAEKHFEIWRSGKLIKSLPIKGLYGKTMPFGEYVALMKQEARSEYQQYVRTHQRLVQGHLWA